MRNRRWPGVPDGSFDIVAFGFSCTSATGRTCSGLRRRQTGSCAAPGWLVIYDFHATHPTRRDYHHLEGYYSYKMDYGTLFRWHPDYQMYAQKGSPPRIGRVIRMMLAVGRLPPPCCETSSSDHPTTIGTLRYRPVLELPLSNSRNHTGQVGGWMVSAIVGRGRAAGVDTLDTAMGYGDSEMRLGEAGVADWKVVTKLLLVPSDCGDVPGWCVTMVGASLQRLRVSRLYGLLMHRAADLAGPMREAVISGLRRLKQMGRVAKTG